MGDKETLSKEMMGRIRAQHTDERNKVIDAALGIPVENKNGSKDISAEIAEELNFSRKTVNEQVIQIAYDLNILNERLKTSQQTVSDLMSDPDIDNSEHDSLEEALSFLVDFQVSIEDVKDGSVTLTQILADSIGKNIKWAKKQKKSDAIPIIRLKDGSKFHLRAVGKAHKYYWIYNVANKSSASTNGSDKCKNMKSHGSLKVSERHALQVIDRKDGQLKIAELAPSAYNKLMTVAESSFTPEEIINNGTDCFGIADGIDFMLSRTGQMLNTRYNVQFIGRTQLTSSDLKMVQNKMVSDLSKACGQIDNAADLKNKLGV